MRLLGECVVYLHITPSEFWSMTPSEYWAIASVANPDIDKDINSNSTSFTDEELEEWNEFQKLLEEEEQQRLLTE